jgi:hypothetical protein
MVIDSALRPVDAGFAVVRRVACTDRLTNALINFDICAICPSCNPLNRAHLKFPMVANSRQPVRIH